MTDRYVVILGEEERRLVDNALMLCGFEEGSPLRHRLTNAPTESDVADRVAKAVREGHQRECGEPCDDGSGRVCRRLCEAGRDYHGGGHWYASPDLDGDLVRHSTAHALVTNNCEVKRGT